MKKELHGVLLIIRNKHESGRNDKQNGRNENGLIAKMRNQPVSACRTKSESQDYQEVMKTLYKGFSFMCPDVMGNGGDAASDVADAHCRSIWIAMCGTEGLNLECTAEGNKTVRKRIQICIKEGRGSQGNDFH